MIFNTTLILFGVLTVLAAYFTNRVLQQRSFSILLGIFGLGILIDGVFAENVQLTIHLLGGIVALAGPIAAITVYRLREATPRYFQYFSVAMGIFVLVATLIFFITGPPGTLQSSAIGVGGLERIILYPLMIWQALLGMVFLARYRS